MPKKGYKQTIEHKNKIGVANKGKERTEETKIKLRLSHLGKPSNVKGKHWINYFKKPLCIQELI